MPSSLPSEILDLIVDYLHDDPTALKTCCLLSKSWISRTRTHLFSRVKFHLEKAPLKSWMKAFPDPSNSPACYSSHLLICGPPVTVVAGIDARAWIRAFDHIVALKVDTGRGGDDQVSLIPLHGLSPTLKSLSLLFRSIPLSEIFDFVCSLPSLENLKLISVGKDDEPSEWTTQTSPELTGALYLLVEPSLGGIRTTVRRLLDLPGGLHFSKVHVGYPMEDAESTRSLVSRCSGTLECLHVACQFSKDAITIYDTPPPLDLSKHTKLKDLDFVWSGWTIRWITMTLETIKSKHLREINVRLYTPSPPLNPTEAIRNEWQELDNLLVRLWEGSRPVRPKVRCNKFGHPQDTEEAMGALLPKLAHMGAIQYRTQCTVPRGVPVRPMTADDEPIRRSPMIDPEMLEDWE